jgi:hypothetical protein
MGELRHISTTLKQRHWMEVSGQLHPLVSFHWRLDGIQSQSGRYRQEKLLRLLEIEPQILIHPARRIVRLPTELYRQLILESE